MRNRPDPLYLAVDQGGHASRAFVFDAKGAVAASAFAPLETRRPREGEVEHDAESMVDSVRAAVGDALEPVDAARVRAAGLATQRSSIVCWDRRTGEALSPVISWQDRRNSAWLERQDIDAVRLREITGLVPSPHYGASKLRWCLDRIEAVRRARERNALAAGPVASFLLFRMLAERPLVVDPANASRTLLWDYRSRDWSASLLERFGIPRAVLPDCVGSRHRFGSFDVGGTDIPLTVCTGDQSAVPFAFGPPRAGAAFVNLGTGAFVQRLIDRAPRDAHGLLISVSWQHGEEALYALEGTVNGAGSALSAIGGDEGIDPDALPDAPADEEPPLFLNGIGGLGAPFWIADFESRFAGVGGPAARLRAVQESIAFLINVNLGLMQALAGRLNTLVVTGGLASSDALCRSIADLSGVRVLRPTLREATARGLAWLVADRPAGWDMPMETIEPARNAPLRSRYATWLELMRAAGAAVPGAVSAS